MSPFTAAPDARTFGWPGYPIGRPPCAVPLETWDMGTTALGRMAGDREEVGVPASGGRWSMAWHRASSWSARSGRAPVDGGGRRADLLPRRPGGAGRLMAG